MSPFETQSYPGAEVIIEAGNKVGDVLENTTIGFREITTGEKGYILGEAGMDQMGHLLDIENQPNDTMLAQGHSGTGWDNDKLPHRPNPKNLHAANDDQFQQAA